MVGSPTRHGRASIFSAPLSVAIVIGVVTLGGASVGTWEQMAVARAVRPTLSGEAKGFRYGGAELGLRLRLLRLRFGRQALGTLTFTKDIAPIVFERCAACHRPGGHAPFSLLTYQDVRARAQQIAVVTSSRYMPPWKPEPGYGEFAGARRLSDEQIALIQQWVEAGASEGDLSDLPPTPTWPAGWLLGEPGLVVKMPEPYTLPSEGADVYRNFAIPIPVTKTRYVRGIEFRPGNARAVHHARILTDRTGRSRMLDEDDPEPGYDGLLVDEARFPDGHFLGWAPGKMPSTVPEDLAWRLDPGTDLVLQLHLLPTGEPQVLQAEVGFFFSETPPTRQPLVLPLSSKAIDIPAGEADYLVEDRYTLPVDVDVLRVYPHAHYLGKDMRGYATLPDGTVKALIHIADWDFNWQDEYQYAEPIHLTKGTTVTMRYVFDNSAGNVRNPSRPPRRVVFGPESTDEMAELLFQVLPQNGADLAVLQQDLAVKAVQVDIAAFETLIRDDPDDHVSHNGLALRYLQLGRNEEAIAHFEESVRLEPDFAEAHYNLGTVLAGAGRLEESVTSFGRAVELRPGHAQSHNNLGAVLQSLGKSEEAIQHYRQAVQIDPRDVGSYQNLGLALRSMGLLDQAVAAYRQALEVRPNDFETHNALGITLAAQLRLDEAISHFFTVLDLKPDYLEAHYNLASSFATQRKSAEAIGHFRRALDVRPDWPPSLTGLAWLLATYPDPAARDAVEAVTLAERAAEVTNHEDVRALDVLAAAYASAGRFDQAVTTARAALELASARDQESLAAGIRQRLQTYLRYRPYRQPY